MDLYYSENLLCFRGANTFTIIDLEKENTVFNSNDKRFSNNYTMNQIIMRKTSEIPDHKMFKDERDY